jgi:kinesin family protein 4/21/27
VQVCCVVRPLLEAEIAGARSVSSLSPALNFLTPLARSAAEGATSCIELTPLLGTSAARVSLSSGASFELDGAFEGPDASAQLFNACVASLVDSLLQGFNGSVLCAGQTGAGKTHTMGLHGSAAHSNGLVPSAAARLFSLLALPCAAWPGPSEVHASFVEVYGEEVRDLLAKPGAPPLELRDAASGAGAAVPDATLQRCACVGDLLGALGRGARLRATGSTNMNATSSRSHAVLTLHLTRFGADGKVMSAKLTLVDLAGSERLKKTGAEGARQKEGSAINQGLLALGNVCAALLERRPHIPYRSSKLTRLLSDGLGGNARSVLVACLSPADTSQGETGNTLAFAQRCRGICTLVTANVALAGPMCEAEATALRALAAALQREISALRAARGEGDARSPKRAFGGGRALAELQARAETAEEQDARVTCVKDICLQKCVCARGRAHPFQLLSAKRRFQERKRD